MAGGPVRFALPPLKDDGKEETHEEVPRTEWKRFRQMLSRLFKKERVQEQERGFSVQRRNPEQYRKALQAAKEAMHDQRSVQTGGPIPNSFRRLQPELETEAEPTPSVSTPNEKIHISLRCKVSTAPAVWAWAWFSISPSTTYDECLAAAGKALRRHHLRLQFPAQPVAHGMIVDWHTGFDMAPALPREILGNNFQESLLIYSRYVQRVMRERWDVVFEPVTMELILCGLGLPTTMEKQEHDLEDQRQVRDELTHGLERHNGIPMPPHMSQPGQDGYRTPTVHDYERVEAESGEKTHRRGTPSPSAGLSRRQSGANPASRSMIDLGLERLQWNERLKHYTWTFFTMTMATGGIANVLYTVPFRFPGLYAIGVIFFLFNLLLFVINVTMISLRFYTFPGMFRTSYMHPTERLFLPASVVSFGTVLINISQYGLTRAGPWLSRAVLVFFWIDAGLAVLTSSGVYLLMWSTKSFTVEQMTPVWIFPIYPLLIIGPHAAILCATLDPTDALDIMIGGFTLQGIGFLVAFMIYSSFIYRLMTQKLPQASARPGMFVSVGPSGFTVAAILGMADSLSRNVTADVNADFMGDGPLAAMIAKVIANWVCLWIWGLAMWFFFVSVGAHWSCARQDGGFAFGMNWFSFIFPNTALITATFAVGKAFRSRGLQIVGCVMTVVLVMAWFVVFGLMIRAIAQKQVLWPQKGEDKDEGGFKAPQTLERRDTLKKMASNVISPIRSHRQ
ncbi:MAG: hypothetical protein LQ341_004072 [Variospora aurantia]|nr:MAG: hypothetical protein LQ341_004072 [Variospora aurantia]